MAGRPTKLTEKVFNAIVKSVRNGNYFSTACEAAGVSELRGLEWIRRGEDRDRRVSTKLYAKFAKEIRIAKAKAEEDHVSVLQKAAMGWEEVTTKQDVDPTKKDQQGKPKIQSIEIKRVKKFDWRASLAYLGRTKKAKWGDRSDDDGDDTNEPKIINLPSGGPWSQLGWGGDNGCNGDDKPKRKPKGEAGSPDAM